MSTVLWVNYLKDGKVTSDESDKWALYRFAPRVDRLCAKVGVRPLSEFHDTTDAEANLAPETEASGAPANTWELMAQRGKWFEPDEGLAVVHALLAALEKQPVRFGLISNRYDQVVEELRECRASIASARQMGARFHLSVVT